MKPAIFFLAGTQKFDGLELDCAQPPSFACHLVSQWSSRTLICSWEHVFPFPSWVLFKSFQPFSRFSGFFSYQSHDELMINRTRALSPIIPDFPNENGLTPENEELEIVLSTILLNGFWFPQRRGFVALFCFSKGCISSRKLQGRFF